MDQIEQLNNVVQEDGPPDPVKDTTVEPFDFAGTVEKFETPLLRYAGHLIGPNNSETEDVVQEAFLRLHRKVERDGADSINNISVWLYRVTHNLAMDTGRKLTRRKKASEKLTRDAIEEETASVAEEEALGAMIRREVCDRAMAELKKLPEDLRNVVLLKIIQGLTMSQISEVVGISASNVCYRLSQALRTISGKLKEAGLI